MKSNLVLGAVQVRREDSLHWLSATIFRREYLDEMRILVALCVK